MYDTLIIGGGFYGASLAIEFAKKGKSVCLLEKENSLLGRASYHNQARVHGGYHYPRSFLTGVRSRENFDRFVAEYTQAIFKDFSKIYAIAKNSKVTPVQFKNFCERIGSPIKPAEAKVADLFSKDTIEAVFEVQEYAFSAKVLTDIVTKQMSELNVQVFTKSEATTITAGVDGALKVEYQKSGEAQTIEAHEVYLATYSRLNEVLTKSGLPIVPLRHELTEMALVEAPAEIGNIGVTVMDGPFWSLMPFPPRGLMTLSHVRYTPHYQWSDEKDFNMAADSNMDRKSNFELMIKDAVRFLPKLGAAKHRDSLWEVKTIMPRSDGNDSRPILLRKNYGIRGLNLVLGGKIDNVFDIIDMINKNEPT